MITFTAADIYAAKNNDLSAIRLVTGAVTPVIDRIASKLAHEVRTYGSDLSDELAAEGRLILWSLISKHDGSEDHGSDWLVGSIRPEMRKARGRLLNPGAERQAVDVFLYCMARCDNDPAKAEEMATSLPDTNRRLSKGSAAAARMACSVSVSLDTPVGDFIADIKADDEMDDVISRVGIGAALEALSVLHRHSAAYEALLALPKSVADVESIEDLVTLPRDAEDRRDVLSAVSILRSFVGAIPDDEPEDDEIIPTNAAHIQSLVRRTVDGMSPKQALCITQMEALRIPSEVVAETSDYTKRSLDQEWSRARKTFWTRFPWTDAYGTPKPALVLKRNSN